MLLMMVINPWEWVFRNRKHCCFCVCSLRVHVRMSAASGGKFCVNIFCFRDPPPLPSRCVVFIFCLFLIRNMCCSRFKYNNTSSLGLHTLLVILVLPQRETFVYFYFDVICLLQIFQQQYDIRSALISSWYSAKILVGDNDAHQRFIWFCVLPCLVENQSH